MIANNSLEANAAPAEGVVQSVFEKESASPGGTGRRTTKRSGKGHVAEATTGPGVVEPASQPASPVDRLQEKANQCIVEQGEVINKVILAGRLGRDADVRQTKDGRIVANFSVGTDDSYQDRLGEWQKKTTWHRVQVWGEVAEAASPGLRKGSRVYVEGKLINRNWVDKQSRRRMSTEVVASDVRFLDPAPKKERAESSEPVEESNSATE